jgi:hypothetical protein
MALPKFRHPGVARVSAVCFRCGVPGYLPNHRVTVS